MLLVIIPLGQLTIGFTPWTVMFQVNMDDQAILIPNQIYPINLFYLTIIYII